MKKLLLVAPLFCLISSIAGAQVEKQKPVLCYPIGQLIKEIKEMREEPQWTGSSIQGESQYLLVANEKDKGWTLIQFDGVNGCVIGAGTKSRLIFKTI
jgi:hypothetical protein